MWISVNLFCATPGGVTGPVNASPKDFDSIFADAIKDVKEELEYYDAKDLTLQMDLEYEDQCNLEFTPEQVKAIADLGIRFAITCWEKE
ncbi:MAG: hypothetical protein ACXAC5_03830 [Promethearchaeota archaeon]|jgi:hypothetical protein